MTEKILKKVKENEILRVKNERILLKEINRLKEEIGKRKKEGKIPVRILDDFFNKIENAPYFKSGKLFEENGILSYATFMELVEGEENVFLVLTDVSEYSEEKKRFVYAFYTNKVSQLFTFSEDRKIIIGAVSDREVETIKQTKGIPYFSAENGEFSEINLYNVLFMVDVMEEYKMKNIFKIFENIRKRPAYANKHFVVFSMESKKIVDYEEEKIKKEKFKYAYVYEKPYPVLEGILKREYKSLPFLLTLLERIDKEAEEIKSSRGTQNVVNRILNFIEVKTTDKTILDYTRTLRKHLK